MFANVSCRPNLYQISRLEVEAHVPPHRLRREILSWQSGVLMAKRNNTTACRLILECSLLVNRGVRPLAVRMHFLSENSGIKVNEMESLVKNSLPPWEGSKINIKTSWLLTKKAHTSESEVHQLFRQVIIDHLSYVHLYTDGFKTDECVGASVWSMECALRYRLPNHTSVFCAELFGVDRAIDYVIISNHSKAIIFSDSLSSLKARSIQSPVNYMAILFIT